MQTGRFTLLFFFFFPSEYPKNYLTGKEVFPDTAEIDQKNPAGIRETFEISMTTIPHHPDRGPAESEISDYMNGATGAATKI